MYLWPQAQMVSYYTSSTSAFITQLASILALWVFEEVGINGSLRR